MIGIPLIYKCHIIYRIANMCMVSRERVANMTVPFRPRTCWTLSTIPSSTREDRPSMTKSIMCPAVTAGCSRCGKCPHLLTVTILAAGINFEILLVIFVPTTSSSYPQITRVGTATFERWMQKRGDSTRGGPGMQTIY